MGHLSSVDSGRRTEMNISSYAYSVVKNFVGMHSFRGDNIATQWGACVRCGTADKRVQHEWTWWPKRSTTRRQDCTGATYTRK